MREFVYMQVVDIEKRNRKKKNLVTNKQVIFKENQIKEKNLKKILINFFYK